MDSAPSIGGLVAFTAGLLSFLSPCVLPLVPSYVTFISGLTIEDASQHRRLALLHTLLFVLGFTLVFLALGASATVLGRLLLVHREWISRIGGVLMLVFGAYLLGVLDIAAFARERRLHLATKPAGFLGTVLVGAAFGAGWTPCIGPVLASILGLAATSATVAQGTGLLLAYSMGLAVPFFVAALLLDRFLPALARARPMLRWVNGLAGLLLIAIGLLLLTGRFTILAASLEALTPDALRRRL